MIIRLHALAILLVLMLSFPNLARSDDRPDCPLPGDNVCQCNWYKGGTKECRVPDLTRWLYGGVCNCVSPNYGCVQPYLCPGATCDDEETVIDYIRNWYLGEGEHCSFNVDLNPVWTNVIEGGTAPTPTVQERIHDVDGTRYLTSNPPCRPFQYTNNDSCLKTGRNRKRVCPAGWHFVAPARTTVGGVCVRDPEADCQSAGNPISTRSGIKREQFVDFVTAGSELMFKRTYSSDGFGGDAWDVELEEVESRKHQPLGQVWRHQFDWRISTSDDGSWAVVRGPSESTLSFRRISGQWVRLQNSGQRYVLSDIVDNQTLIGRELLLPDGTVQIYDDAGMLLSQHQPHGTVFEFEYSDALTHPDLAPKPGLLMEVRLQQGRGLYFRYNDKGMIREMHDDQGLVGTYTYDIEDRLVSVTRSDDSAIVYHYNEPEHITGQASQVNWPHLLTGVTDESNQRFQTWRYNVLSSGTVRAFESHHGGALEANRTTITYNTSSRSTVTNSLGGATQVNFALRAGVWRITSMSSACSACGGIAGSAIGYDTNGYRNLVTDFEGNVTDYDYQADGRLERVMEGVGTPQQRTIETDWWVATNLPTERRVYNAANTLQSRENWTYNTRGQVLTRTTTDPATSANRTWTYSYCEQADVDAPGSTCPILGYRKAIDGPRTDVADVIQFAYYLATNESGCDTGGTCHRRGDLWTVTNALGHVTEHLRYDRAGRVTRVRDANAVLTDLSYHPRGWLEQRIVRARADGVADAGDAVTTFAYTATGLIERITQPDGDHIDYSYDGAQRLVGIADALGNHIVYTLDPAGNRIAEETFDPADALRRRLAREYNTLGRLVAERDAIVDASHPNGRLVAEHGYDGNGNRTHTIDGLGRRSDHEYDPLNRLKKSLDALNPRGVVEFAYDARDHLIQVTDPKGLLTEYVYDGLGDLRELRSPDTGTTVYSYDDAGNRIEQTDARGVVTEYAYDALNRLTGIHYPADSSLDVSFVYDTVQPGCGAGETFAIGRLTGVADPAGSTTLCYDHRGNLTRKALDDGFGNLLVSRYSYTRGDRLAATTYPSALEVELQYDNAGRISTLRWRTHATAAWQNLVTGVHYRPFGPLAGFSFGNGRAISKDYDGNYAIDALASSAADGLNLDFEVDVLGNIVAITPTGTNNPEQERHYAYDPLYRLTEVRDTNQALIEAFTYDPTGNRTSKQVGTDPAQPYGYPTDSHRLTSVDGLPRTFDDAGNLSSVATPDFFGSTSYNHGAHNRLSSLSQNGHSFANYVYNGQGERACKWLGITPIRYVYDSGGRLLGEYGASGKPIAEYVYMGTLPVAVFTAAGLAFIETDHLGTPRVVIDAKENFALWRWPLTGSAFGEHAPNEDPHGSGTPYIFNLRFPGQYFDAESGLHYNYFRDYEPGIGRYVQSDPIGLGGGINTYAYVRNSALNYFDSRGLQRVCYSSSTPRWELDLVNGGLVQEGWHPWREEKCVCTPNHSEYLRDCDRDCERKQEDCNWKTFYGGVSFAAFTLLGLFAPEGATTICALGGVALFFAAGSETLSCEEKMNKCKDRCNPCR